jgi:hypothetical protein
MVGTFTGAFYEGGEGRGRIELERHAESAHTTDVKDSNSRGVSRLVHNAAIAT